MIVEILKTDDDLGIKAGEFYFASRYVLDPMSKVTLRARIPDGHDPCCNQYFHTVKRLTLDEFERRVTSND